MHVCLCQYTLHIWGAQGGQKRVSDALDLFLIAA